MYLKEELPNVSSSQRKAGPGDKAPRLFFACNEATFNQLSTKDFPLCTYIFLYKITLN